MSVDEKNNSEALQVRERIIDAAEQLFADQGFDAVSLRQITTRADVNLAAVNYYFGSKAGLVIEVLRRVAEPINEGRMQMLQEQQAKADGKPVEIEAILYAFLAPLLESVNGSGDSHQVAMKLAGRCMGESGADMPEALKCLFCKTVDLFCEALSLALPTLSEAEISWRMHFTVGAMLYAVTKHETLVILSEGRVKADDADQLLGELVAFTAGGWRAENAKKGGEQ